MYIDIYIYFIPPRIVVFQCVSPHLGAISVPGFFHVNQWVTTNAAVRPRSSRSLARYACECASHAFAWGIDQGTPGGFGGGQKTR